MIAVIDYGAGNLHSVQNALNHLGAENVISSDPEVILRADRVILPGVGAFGDAMAAMRKSGMDQVVRQCAEEDKPLLGICLGLQLLFEKSEETPGVPGLGIFQGEFLKIPEKPGLKIPHIGWNDLTFPAPSRMFEGIGTHPYVYFVHSYYLNTPEQDIVSAYTDYGTRLPVAVEHKNVFAMQFHPEKSGAVGMKILENFIRI